MKDVIVGDKKKSLILTRPAPKEVIYETVSITVERQLYEIGFDTIIS
jgi:hypothetical protein